MKKVLLQVFVLFSFLVANTAFGARPIMSIGNRQPFEFTGRTGVLYGGGVTIGNGRSDNAYIMDNGVNQMLGIRFEYAVSNDFIAHFDLSGNGSVALLESSSYYTDEFTQPFSDGHRSACCSYDYMAGFGGSYLLDAINTSFSVTLGAGQFGFVDGEALSSELSFGYQLQAVRQVLGENLGIGVIYSKLYPTFSEKKYGDIKANAEKIGIIFTSTGF